MKDSSKRLFGLLASLALLAGSFFVFVSFIRPEYARINQLRGDLASKEETYENQSKIIDEVKSLLEQYESISGLREAVSRAIPNEEDYATAINQIGSLARVSGLVLESIEPHLVTPKGTTSLSTQTSSLPVLRTLQMNLKLVGSYDAFKTFLERIETNIRVMDTANITILPSVSANNYAYTVVVKAYYQSL